MLTHSQIWRAIDGLAARHGLSPSGLARLAGLDPTTFNKSKRGTGDKLRWPSTESLAKILAATGSSLEELVGLVSERAAAKSRMVPLIGMAQVGASGYFDDAGFPAGTGWQHIAFPEVSDPHCYALEIAGDFIAPVYRDGGRILVSPAGSVRRGDRVVVKTQGGEVMVRTVGRITAQRIELKSFNPAFEDRSFALGEIAFIHRIIWASQ